MMSSGKTKTTALPHSTSVGTFDPSSTAGIKQGESGSRLMLRKKSSTSGLLQQRSPPAYSAVHGTNGGGGEGATNLTPTTNRIQMQVPIPKNLNELFGVSPSDIDKYSRVVFPVCFVCFNLMYWMIYLHISKILDSEAFQEESTT